MTAKPLLGTSNMAMPPSIAVRALSDASLAKEICDLEQLLTSNPAMATHIQPPLERHVAERARRVACADEEALAEVCAPTDAPDAPDAAEAAPGARCKRARTAPARFAAEDVVNIETYVSPAMLQQQEANKIMKEQVVRNNHMLKTTAKQFACPLRTQKLRDAGEEITDHVACWMKRQARHLAVADDGHYYDFEALKEYILAHMDTQLVSPVTGNPMTAHVHTTKRVRCKHDPNRTIVRPYMWTPMLVA